MKKKNLLRWRIMNTALFGIAFFLPWHMICSDMLPRFCFDIPGWKVLFISIEVLIENPELLSYVQGTLISIGEVCLIIYTLLNCILIIAYSNFQIKYLRIFLLITILFSILMSIQIVEPMFNTGLTWGYWLTCIGLISGLLLEISETIHWKPTESS